MATRRPKRGSAAYLAQTLMEIHDDSWDIDRIESAAKRVGFGLSQKQDWGTLKDLLERLRDEDYDDLAKYVQEGAAKASAMRRGKGRDPKRLPAKRKKKSTNAEMWRKLAKKYKENPELFRRMWESYKRARKKRSRR
jgi:hypothetical protein